MENRVSDNIGREQVLALDVATKTGYYSQHESGTWNFAESKRRNGNKMHGAFRVMLMAFIRRYGINAELLGHEERIRRAVADREVVSLAYVGNVVDLWERLAAEEVNVDLGSDQTSLHNPWAGGATTPRTR